MSVRNNYDYKISLSYNFSSNYTPFVHDISFETCFNEPETDNDWLHGQDKRLMVEDYYVK